MPLSDEFPEYYFEGSDGKMPWDYRCWDAEWEDEYDNETYKTIGEWNDSGRIVKKGEKAQRLPCRRRSIFKIEQTVPYNIFYISKNNGKFRRVFSLYKEQKSQLRELIPYLEKVLLKNDTHKVNYAFIRNKNCVENAMQHIGYNYTVSMDLESFFESINKSHVSKYLNNDILDQCFISGAPQQGLPTSPLIANLAFLDCDKEILNSLEKNNIFSVYTRYADDLIISFDNGKDVGRVVSLITTIVGNAGFKINKKKTKIQNIKNGRVVITGVGVDKKGVHPTRKTLKKIRAAKHAQNNKSFMGLNEWAKCKLPNKKSINLLESQSVVSHYKDGTIKEIIEINKGKQVSKIVNYYPDGSKKKEEFYVDNKLNGLSRTWHKNGSLMKSVGYINGIIHGLVEVCDKEGSCEITQFDQGSQIEFYFPP